MDKGVLLEHIETYFDVTDLAPRTEAYVLRQEWFQVNSLKTPGVEVFINSKIDASLVFQDHISNGLSTVGIVFRGKNFQLYNHALRFSYHVPMELASTLRKLKEFYLEKT